MTTSSRAFFCTLVSLTTCGISLFTSEAHATELKGVVLDPSGKGIPGAQVDSDQLAVYMFVVLTIAILAGVWAYIVLGTPFWRQPPPPKPIIRRRE